jgi:ankyrin repeat protein
MANPKVLGMKQSGTLVLLAFMTTQLFIGACKTQGLTSDEARAELSRRGVEYKEEALLAAAKAGDVAIIQLFLDSGMSLDVTDKNDDTPLHWAAFHGHLGAVKVLLARGANPNARREGGATPLGQAALGGHTEIATVLMQSGANVNMSDDNGWTPLMYASFSCFHGSVEALLAGGADVNARGLESGITALTLAVGGIGQHEALKRLNEIPFGSLLVDQSRTVRLLIDNGADVNRRESSGKTALSIAREKSLAEIVQMLARAGATE